jgi:hypothetical protein
MTKTSMLLATLAATALIAGCTTPQEDGNMTDGTQSSEGSSGSGGTSGGSASGGGSGGTGTSLPGLVNVNLENVLNDLSVRLNIDRANIPVNAQVPVTVAANVCGVSVNVLSVSTGGQASCNATTTSPELVQVVQQQVAAGGNVGGGDQTTTSPTNNMM